MRGDISKWKIYINYKDFAHTTEVFIGRECEGEYYEYITKMEGKNIEVKKIKYGEVIDNPLFIFHGMLSQDIMQAFADACNEYGFKPKGKPILENEMTAIKYHLEDMRKLVFNKGD